MYRTFVEMEDEFGTKYMGMVGNTIQSLKRAISRIKGGQKGWVVDANNHDKIVHISGFGTNYEAVL